MAKAKKPTRAVASEPSQIAIGPGFVAAILVVVALVAVGAWWALGQRGAGGANMTGSAPGAVTVDTARSSETSAATGGASASAMPGGGPAGNPGQSVPTGVDANGNPVLGAPSAPVTIEIFSDFQCPNCRQFATEVVPWMRQSWLADGFVKVVYHDFAARGSESVLAAQAAHCAGDQGRFWEFHDVLFNAQSGENKGAFSTAKLHDMAQSLGLELASFDKCLDSGKYKTAVETASKAAMDRGFRGTPTYLVNGRETRGAIQTAEWDKLFKLYQAEFVPPTVAPVVPGAPTAPAAAVTAGAAP